MTQGQPSERAGKGVVRRQRTGKATQSHRLNGDGSRSSKTSCARHSVVGVGDTARRGGR